MEIRAGILNRMYKVVTIPSVHSVKYSVVPYSFVQYNNLLCLDGRVSIETTLNVEKLGEGHYNDLEHGGGHHMS